MPASNEPSCIVVADAGPLIALGRIDAIGLLPRLFARIEVAETVIAECLARPDLPDATRESAAIQADWLTPCADVPGLVEASIDAGVASSIARARQAGIDLLMDDRAAVAFARRAGLKVIGTLGVLILAKRRGLLDRIAPTIESLSAAGHYLSRSALQAALVLGGEVKES